MGRTICVIPGDGIGPEVTAATLRIIERAGADLEWLTLPAGAAAAEQNGDLLPPETLEAIETHRIALKGPLTTPVGKGFTSLNVRLRKRFSLYAAIRPIRSLPGIPTRYDNVEIVVVRENTEGLYSGLEHQVIPGVIESLKITTRKGCERISRFAFEYAKQRERCKVTLFHKVNPLALLMSGVMMLNHLGMREIGRRIKQAYDNVLASGDPARLTPDIGGTGGTTQFADAVCAEL